MTLQEYLEFRKRVVELDVDAMKKVETKSPPIDAADFVLRVSYVILNSGMRWTVAQDIWTRMKLSLIETGEVGDTFGHPGKKKSINQVVSNRSEYFDGFRSAWQNGPDAVIEFCETLPHIGGITKYHLAKNLGVDIAKPDVWLERVAANSGEGVQELCSRLSKLAGDSVSTVDYVIWKTCQQGWWRTKHSQTPTTNRMTRVRRGLTTLKKN
ncbi:hypothetical protein LB545_23465 [Mesorhizobium sp. BR1-1-6]|uniref:hypothetical protein n=1 Tax=Mesorhizobium sp. BR1-1-6 TaxID=2876648 RepID=UPI001CD1698B|nr:hypothetical protein [Mesorhizobium sp. BR1-1-6]MBZ9897278.1 hypothetical protein [Mesorhizobium sp. BR1-1-6]